MHKKGLQSIKYAGQKLKSHKIRQSSSGNKMLKVTNKGQHIKKQSSSKQRNTQSKLIISQQGKNKKSEQKIVKKGKNTKNMLTQPDSSSTQKQRTKLFSYKTSENDLQDKQQLKKSLVDIDMTFDDTLDDDINLLSISNYPTKDNQGFLRQTHVTQGVSKSKYAIQKQKQKQRNNLLKLPTKIQKTSSQKSQSKGLQRKKSSDNLLMVTNRQRIVQKVRQSSKNSHQQLKKSQRQISNSNNRQIDRLNRGQIRKSTKKLQDQKGSKEQKSSNNQINKERINKNSSNKNIKIGKSPTNVNAPKSVSKSSKQKTKIRQKSKIKKQTSKINPLPQEQQSSSDTTNAPTFQQLQKLRQQNEKYKYFLASSAFKVDQLKRQIQESKHIRETQRSMYNYQLNNLKRQLDSNKKYLGHLFSYDQHSNGNFLPQQIIIQTDDQSSSVLDSIKMFSKLSKQLNVEDVFSQNNSNKIRKSTQSMNQIVQSNPSSNQIQNGQKTTKSFSDKIQKDQQIYRQQSQSYNFLQGINKIPSLVMGISLEQSQKDSLINKQPYSSKRFEQDLKSFNRISPVLGKKKSSQQYSDINLLLSSKGK